MIILQIREMSSDALLAEKLKEQLFSMIEKTMEKNGITQAEVARRIGARRNNINKVMRRKDAVSLDFLLKIAESIGLDVEMKIRQKK
jgi:plasmid maintenance system antidote protein VapI